MERYTDEQRKSFLKAIESLKKYRRADLIDEEGNNLLEKLYTDLLPNNHILNQSLQDNTTFLIGRKGTGKSTIFLRIEQELRKKKGYLPCYIDVKTVFESAQTESLPDYLDSIITNRQFYDEYAIKRNFIRKILSRVIDEIDNKIDSFFKRALTLFRSDEVKGNIAILRKRIDDNSILKDIEIPSLQKIQIKENTNSSQTQETSLGSKTTVGIEMEKIPSVKLCNGVDDKNTQSRSSGEGTEMVYTKVLLKVLQISDLIEQLQSELKRIGINHLVILLDDFSEIPYAEMRTFVDVVLAPLNNWSNEFIKFKVAAYPGRIYYGKIDIGKIDTVNLDFYNLYSVFERDKMEEGAINFTQRLLEKRIKYYCNTEASLFFDAKQSFSMADYYRLLFYVSMNVPRVMGYVLSFCYQNSILYDKPISKNDIEKAAQKYYEDKVEPFFSETMYSMMSHEEKIDTLQLKEMLDMFIKRMKEVKKNIVTSVYTGELYVPSMPYSSHFYLKDAEANYVDTLELNFFISKYTELIDKDGKKVNVYSLNYGLCEKNGILWGKPIGRKFAKYFVQRPFDLSISLHEFLLGSKSIRCTNCRKHFTQEQIPLLEFSHFKCNDCGGKVVISSVLGEDLKKRLRMIDSQSLLPPTETRILIFLCKHKDMYYARDIAEEIDASTQSVAMTCKKLEENYDYVHREKGDGVFKYCATDKARNFYQAE